MKTSNRIISNAALVSPKVYLSVQTKIYQTFYITSIINKQIKNAMAYNCAYTNVVKPKHSFTITNKAFHYKSIEKILNQATIFSLNRRFFNQGYFKHVHQ